MTKVLVLTGTMKNAGAWKRAQREIAADEMILSKPTRLAAVVEEPKKTLVERAQEIRRERIESAVNDFWIKVNEEESKIASKMIEFVEANPLAGNVDASYTIEIEKDGYEEFILKALEDAKEAMVEYWLQEGVAADVSSISKDDTIKVFFRYFMTY